MSPNNIGGAIGIGMISGMGPYLAMNVTPGPESIARTLVAKVSLFIFIPMAVWGFFQWQWLGWTLLIACCMLALFGFVDGDPDVEVSENVQATVETGIDVGAKLAQRGIDSGGGRSDAIESGVEATRINDLL